MWTAVRAAVLIGAGVAFGANFAWVKLPLAMGILILIMLAYLPFGLISAASVIAFRTATPLGRGVLLISTLLGGVYYSTRVIPSWLQDISDYIPLTYGLRALRRTLLEGMPLRAVAGDLVVLVGFILGLFILSSYLFSQALKYAKRSGSLSHY